MGVEAGLTAKACVISTVSYALQGRVIFFLGVCTKEEAAVENQKTTKMQPLSLLAW